MGAPPAFVGVMFAVLPTLKVAGFGVYASEDGTTSFTVMLTVTPEEVPPELVAVTLNVFVVVIALAVPEIIPVELLNAIPVGKLVGEIVYEVGTPPEYEGTIFTLFPTV
jgi:hypothetical protein